MTSTLQRRSLSECCDRLPRTGDATARHGLGLARPPRVVGRRPRRSRARRATRPPRHRRPRRSPRAHTQRAARGPAHLARRVGGDAAARRATGRVRRPLARAGHRADRGRRLPLDDGVRFAARRAELTQAAADAHPGRMAALLGATPEQAEEACEAAPDGCWVANDNAPGQVVIAGTPEGLDAGFGPGEGARREAGHARSTSAAPSTRRSCATPAPGSSWSWRRSTFTVPAAPVVSNHDAVAYADADGWRERLAEHVSVPVRWRSTMDTLVAAGRRHVPRSRPRLDARGARQARRPRRHRSQRRRSRRHRHGVRDSARHPHEVGGRVSPWRLC